MRSVDDQAIQITGFWVAGFLALVLVTFKLTVAVRWSWWRVILPALAILGNNVIYFLVGFFCLFWVKREEGEDEEDDPVTVQGYARDGYIIWAMLFLYFFFDNLLRRMEGRGWGGFWPCSGKLAVIYLFGTLNVMAHVLYWSRIVRGLNEERAWLNP